jgi:two-component system OmpR family response regulator
MAVAFVRVDRLRWTNMKILVVEDDVVVGLALMRALKDAGCAVDWLRDGEGAGDVVRDCSYAAVLLDLGLPRASGMELLRYARRANAETPIFIITARDDVKSRIEGLDAGADDFIVKPFDSTELLARIRAVLRRKAGFASSRMGGSRVSLDLNLRELTCDGVSGTLSAREFALCAALLERPGSILSREVLESRLYGWGQEVESNAVDVIIYGLRRRFGSGVIRNIRGVGWTIETESRQFRPGE